MNAHMILVISGPLLFVLAIPLWVRRVPPNVLYGVRTRATLADAGLWYDVNAACGRDLAIAGALVTAGTWVIDARSAAWVPELRNLAIAALLVVSLVWVSLRCRSALRSAREAR
ncbi:MAG: SdpI family protein [Gemmatimonadaceae bacterium]